MSKEFDKILSNSDKIKTPFVECYVLNFVLSIKTFKNPKHDLFKGFCSRQKKKNDKVFRKNITDILIVKVEICDLFSINLMTKNDNMLVKRQFFKTYYFTFERMF